MYNGTIITTVLEMNIWIYLSESNPWIYLSESNPWIYFYITVVLKKITEKFTDLNKVLLDLDRRTGAHREDY